MASTDMSTGGEFQEFLSISDGNEMEALVSNDNEVLPSNDSDAYNALEGQLYHRRGLIWHRVNVFFNLGDGGSLSVYEKKKKRGFLKYGSVEVGSSDDQSILSDGRDQDESVDGHSLSTTATEPLGKKKLLYQKNPLSQFKFFQNDDDLRHSMQKNIDTKTRLLPDNDPSLLVCFPADGNWELIDHESNNVFVIKENDGNTTKKYFFKCHYGGNEKALWLEAARKVQKLSQITKSKNLGKKIINKIAPSSKTVRTRRLSIVNDVTGDLQTFTQQNEHDDNLHKVLDESYRNEIERIFKSTRHMKQKEYKVIPNYAYPHRWMTLEELYTEMLGPSTTFHDLRSPDHDKAIGSLHVELLSCTGLPKLDRFTALIDPVACMVLESCAFATDMLPNQTNPMWLRRSKRACIFPVYHGFSQLFVGVFDDDGEKEKDDFAGRVVIDLCNLRPGTLYDVTLPLRLSNNVYLRDKRGVIRLRIRLNWKSERAAVLSYIDKRTLKVNSREPSAVVKCGDAKAFQNVAMTVHGQDLPSRFSNKSMVAAQREYKIYKAMFIYTVKKEIKDLIMWKCPSISLLVFFGWMNSIYANSMALFPPYFVLLIIALLLRNYGSKAVQEGSWGFDRVSFGEILFSLLFGSQQSSRQYMKALDSEQRTGKGLFIQLLSFLGLTEKSNDLYPLAIASKDFSHVNHMEFPFSFADMPESRKMTVDEVTCKKLVVSNIFEDDDDVEDEEAEEKTEGEEKYVSQMDEDEYSNDGSGRKHDEKRPKNASINQNAHQRLKSTQPPSAVLKAMVRVLNKDTMYLFENRLYLENESSQEEKLLKVLGLDKYGNPIKATKALYLGPMIDIAKIFLTAYRSFFNIVMWKDPFMTSWLIIFLIFHVGILLIFPWRIFFFVVGFCAFGPQNYFIRIFKQKSKKKENQSNTQVEPPENVTESEEESELDAPAFFWQAGKKKAQDELKSENLQIIVPCTRLRRHRFYDWPPILPESIAKPIEK